MRDTWNTIKKYHKRNGAPIEVDDKADPFIAIGVAIPTIVLFQVFSYILSYLVYIEGSDYSVFWYVLTGVISLVLIMYITAVEAHKSPVGIKGHYEVEKRFLALEIPNIIQLTSILGLVTSLLQNTGGRLVVSMAITILMYAYLYFKRQDFVKRYSTRVTKSLNPTTLALINLFESMGIGAIVFWLAFLIAGLTPGA